jgi:hypothetical protein
MIAVRVRWSVAPGGTYRVEPLRRLGTGSAVHLVDHGGVEVESLYLPAPQIAEGIGPRHDHLRAESR